MTTAINYTRRGYALTAETDVPGSVFMTDNDLSLKAKALEAALVAYADPSGQGLTTVQDAIRWLVYRELNRPADILTGQVSALAARIEEQAQVISTQAGLIRRLREDLDAAAHGKVRTAPASNPALTIDEAQTLRLNLRERGSYSGSANGVGADSIAGAIDEIAGLAKVSPKPDNQLQRDGGALYVPRQLSAWAKVAAAFDEDSQIPSGKIVELPQEPWEEVSDSNGMAENGRSALAIQVDGLYMVMAAIQYDDGSGTRGTGVAINGKSTVMLSFPNQAPAGVAHWVGPLAQGDVVDIAGFMTGKGATLIRAELTVVLLEQF